MTQIQPKEFFAFAYGYMSNMPISLVVKDQLLVSIGKDSGLSIPEMQEFTKALVEHIMWDTKKTLEKIGIDPKSWGM